MISWRFFGEWLVKKKPLTEDSTLSVPVKVKDLSDTCKQQIIINDNKNRTEGTSIIFWFMFAVLLLVIVKTII